MTTSLNLGQMFMIGFDGMTVAAGHPVVEAIVREQVGGVILFDRNVDGTGQNIQSPGQLRELTAALQGVADIPLLIGVDQEGGRVCRLKEKDGFPATVSAKRLGAQPDVTATRRQAERMAATLADHGINLNLAPVVDLDLNPDNPIIGRYERSFGAEPGPVVRHAAAFIAAHHARGVACCLKHFPGHGSSGGDSHLGFVDSSECWREIELEPYRRLFQTGFADAVMTAHVVQRGLDPRGLPATLSGPMVGGLLRGRLGFTGVVVSDDLQMRAITEKWSYEEAVQMAVLAGVDLLIVGNNLLRRENVVAEGVRAIERLLDSNRIGEEVLRAAVYRVSLLKQKIAGEVPWTKNGPMT